MGACIPVIIKRVAAATKAALKLSTSRMSFLKKPTANVMSAIQHYQLLTVVQRPPSTHWQMAVLSALASC